MSGSQTLPEEHDAQREMEQRSLRNVRSLLDRLEHEEDLERRTRRRIGWALLVAALVVAGGVIAWYALRGPEQSSRTITISVPSRP
ncbi:MAG TPA: hypothetical protein VFE23_17370 [Usitatibacter sp.]|jgi:ferric-dicitrate binding protein FerR (iron transport regulator)|nr:hypothetical protein [Usitatibacter sp.]